MWFTGRWYTSGGVTYTARVREAYDRKTWTHPDFLAYG